MVYVKNRHIGESGRLISDIMDMATVLGKVFGTRWRNPVKLDRARKV